MIEDIKGKVTDIHLDLHNVLMKSDENDFFIVLHGSPMGEIIKGQTQKAQINTFVEKKGNGQTLSQAIAGLMEQRQEFAALFVASILEYFTNNKDLDNQKQIEFLIKELVKIRVNG